MRARRTRANGLAEPVDTDISQHYRPVARQCEERARFPTRRRSGLVDDRIGLEVRSLEGSVELVMGEYARVGWNDSAEGRTLGLRIGGSGQVSAWATLPRDGLGALLDPMDLPGQIAGLLRLLGHTQALSSESVAIAAGVDPVKALSIGEASKMPRSSAQFLLMTDEPLRVRPDEAVSIAAFDAGAAEIGLLLGRRLMESFGRHR